MKFKNQSGQAVLTSEAGQAVLIVLLSLSVVLVIVMYILSRSVTDISLSSKDDNALRAFSAAEAGIERALIAGDVSNSDFSGATINASVSDFAKGATQVVYPISLKSGDVATFWFVEHDDNGNLVCDATNPCFQGDQITFCWGDANTSSSSSTTPAIELTVYYTTTPLDLTTLRVGRQVYDVNTARRASNNFTTATVASCTVAGEQFAFRRGLYLSTANELNITNPTTAGIPLFATVKMLYNDSVAHKVGLILTSSTSPLPSQGQVIESEGKYNDANRKINLYKLHPFIPPLFLNSLYSGTGISQ